MATLAAMLSACSSTTVQQQPAGAKDKWVNITNAQNKIVASFNTADGKVQYYSDPKDAFETLLIIYSNLVTDVQKAQKAQEDSKAKKEKKK